MVRIIPVLFIDDNKELCTLFQIYLEGLGDFTVRTSSNGDEALAYLKDHEVLAVISDYDMPEMDGITLLRNIRAHYPRLPFIMLTGNDSKETAISALNAGADFYQNKGDDFEVQVLDLAHKITVLAERHEAEEADRRKDGILAAISYAAGRLLRGDGWQKDMEEILGHLGKATGAGSVFVIATGEDRATDIRGDSVIWSSENSDVTVGSLAPLIRMCHTSPWESILKNRDEVSGKADDTKDESALNLFGIGSYLLLPVFTDERWWGILGITVPDTDRIFSRAEVHALQMAAGVIGAARYRLYIEEFFRNPVEESLVGIFMIRDGRFEYVNPRLCTIFEYSRDELLHEIRPLDLIVPEKRDDVSNILSSVISGSIPFGHFEVTGTQKTDQIIHLEIYLSRILCGGTESVTGNVMDVTERYVTRSALAESEERFRDLFTNIRDLILLHEPMSEGGRIIEVNAAVPEVLGYDRQTLFKKTLPSLCPDHEQETCMFHCREAADKGKSTVETIFIKDDNSAIPVDVSSRRFVTKGKPVLLSVARDITERTSAEAKIRAGEELLKRNMLVSLREKETLLREIHHRVKNNMQIIISLLKLQDFNTDDPLVHEIIRDCRSRIYSMAVIHEKLYQTDDVAAIRLDEYVKDLGERVISEYEADEHLITLHVLSKSPISVDIGTGIPLGLIINELITNSMKYAFIPGEKGRIMVTINNGTESLTIRVADSGRGLPEGFSEKPANSFGNELITGLAFQLGGTAEWSNESGAVCTITVPLPGNMNKADI
ncbi:MAG TPA: PAS domain S-box protein [Methanospirillum sp.]|nr:PAS domain S-box protein [Methanospirillum sp.]